MSKAPQCPSTVGEKERVKPRAPLARTGATGRELWRGLDELAGTPEFRERLEREFPAFASELDGASRREFMRVMAASMALAGVIATAPGCRRPDYKLLPYAREPEDIIEGKPLYYATAMPLPGGGAEGLLAETFEGRPTKIEGNPLHPINQGKTSVHAQSSVLDLYDPDRITGVTKRAGDGRTNATWAEFDAFARTHFARFSDRQGEGLAFLVEKVSSPSRDAMRNRVLAQWPKAKWLPYEAIDNEAALAGTMSAFGAPCREVLDVAKAKVIVTLERELVGCSGEGGSVADARGFAAGRRVTTTTGDGSRMNRLYAIESMMTLTGGMADHRLRLKPSQVPVYFAALAKAVAARLGGAGSAVAGAIGDTGGVAKDLGIEQKWIDAVAQDLVEGPPGDGPRKPGETLVVVGASMPAEAHALACALNSALGNIGKTVHYTPLVGDCAASSLASIRALADAAPSLDTLVVIGCNPVYDAPADLDYAAKHARIKTTIHVGLHEDETAAASTWRLPRTHFLESWGDVEAIDGTRSVIQPMIRPIAYETGDVEGARSELALLALMLGDDKQDPYEIVRRTWRDAMKASEAEFEKAWRRALHNGLLEGSAGSALRGARSSLEGGALTGVSALLAQRTAGGMETLFRASPSLHDGRYANNGWLQELPDTVSKVTWDNPALISPRTALRLGVTDGQMVTLQLGGRTIDVPVWRQPGLSDDTVVLELGYGRTTSGLIGKGVGFNTYSVRTTGGMRRAGGEVTAKQDVHKIACVQTHWSLEGRPIILETDLPAWQKHGGEFETITDAYGREKTLSFADRLPPSEEAHTPAVTSIYESWQQHDKVYERGPQWGMSIDLTTCVGCGACTTACQAENNIPVVGKSQVLNGREMHWIRVDRYYATPYPAIGHFEADFGTAGPYTGGRSLETPDMLVMPVPCMHCENAPCETVCPVNATVHGDEGLNEMAYNRCIGTRYCSNNCPYKVRRFNYFDYATKRLHGTYAGEDLLKGIVKNEQYVPPRLREKIGAGKGEAQTMQYNPHVTVRERGVMEKCTYCIQRINAARVEVKLEGMDRIPDGYFETACQQACPTDSIVFGDILDPDSRVKALRDNSRSYGLLTYLNTKPRTTYMARLRNPNPTLREAVVDPFHHEGGDEGGGGHGATEKDAGHVMSLPVLPSRRTAAAKALGAALGVGGLA